MARPTIDTKAVKRVIKETLSLRSLGRKAAIGACGLEAIAGEAYGSDWKNDHLTFPPEGTAFFFTITVEAGLLVLEIDTYSARHGHFHTAPEAFDVDAWEEGKLMITVSPVGRTGYALLQQAARRFLRGLDTVLPGGFKLPGLQSSRSH